MIMIAVIISLLASMALVLIRAILGPTAYDRILAANLFGTKIMIFIALLSYLLGDAMYIDIALIYALINFVTTIGLLKYFKYQSLGA